jgi:hypothetical protein
MIVLIAIVIYLAHGISQLILILSQSHHQPPSQPFDTDESPDLQSTMNISHIQTRQTNTEDKTMSVISHATESLALNQQFQSTPKEHDIQPNTNHLPSPPYPCIPKLYGWIRSNPSRHLTLPLFIC